LPPRNALVVGAPNLFFKRGDLGHLIFTPPLEIVPIVNAIYGRRDFGADDNELVKTLH